MCAELQLLRNVPSFSILLFIFGRQFNLFNSMSTNTQENPWKIKEEDNFYENPWISIHKFEVVNPAGKDSLYTTVHFKNKAIGIIPIDEDGNTHLIGQYRFPLNEYSWEIPMGGGKIGIDILESAKRELKEETGFTAARWTNIARIHTSNSVTDEEGFIFIAEQLIAGETEFEETEILQIKKVSLSEAVDMVMKEQITDAISVAGILKVARLRGI
jgi:8-oxo-dGTP pyrophosphatase MutT (NUDIX family)